MVFCADEAAAGMFFDLVNCVAIATSVLAGFALFAVGVTVMNRASIRFAGIAVMLILEEMTR
jgi:hypothetical protein